MSDLLRPREVIRWKGARSAPDRVDLVPEHRLTIVLDGQTLVNLLCLPEKMDHLALGFLHAEGFISSIRDVDSVTMSETDDSYRAEVTRRQIPESSPPIAGREWVMGTGCGGGLSTTGFSSTVTAPGLESGLRVDPMVLSQAMVELSGRAVLYRQSRSCHSAALVRPGGEVIHFAEDLGRHNAVDKVNGSRVKAGGPEPNFILMTTGRITSEVSWKAVRMECPIVASPSAPSLRAVDMAAESGITLVGRLRGQGMLVYTHSWRVNTDTP